jgi:hypothetical protein
MTKMSHFTIAELIRSRTAERLGLNNYPPNEVLPALEFTMGRANQIRNLLGFPMLISSGYRSLELNKHIGGSEDSQHCKGEAIDFTCPAFGPPIKIAKTLAIHIEELGIDQLILEPGWIHASFTLQPRLEILTFKNGRYFKGLV